uniref:Uncharacterized protein n=1 Tax=Steinernema glaseri TaxID=37863 RepID=A0A1I8ANA1_9BILA
MLFSAPQHHIILISCKISTPGNSSWLDSMTSRTDSTSPVQGCEPVLKTGCVRKAGWRSAGKRGLHVDIGIPMALTEDVARVKPCWRKFPFFHVSNHKCNQHMWSPGVSQGFAVRATKVRFLALKSSKISPHRTFLDGNLGTGALACLQACLRVYKPTRCEDLPRTHFRNRASSGILQLRDFEELLPKHDTFTDSSSETD